MAYYIPHLKKWGGHFPRVPHQIAPMQAACNLALFKSLINIKDFLRSLNGESGRASHLVHNSINKLRGATILI